MDPASKTNANPPPPPTPPKHSFFCIPGGLGPSWCSSCEGCLLAFLVFYGKVPFYFGIPVFCVPLWRLPTFLAGKGIVLVLHCGPPLYDKPESSPYAVFKM